MEIQIDRIEQAIITGQHELIESHTHDNWGDAFTYLESRLNLSLSDEMKNGFKSNKNTHTSPRMEMVSRVDCAYTAQVFYDVNVSE